MVGSGLLQRGVPELRLEQEFGGELELGLDFEILFDEVLGAEQFAVSCGEFDSEYGTLAGAQPGWTWGAKMVRPGEHLQEGPRRAQRSEHDGRYGDVRRRGSIKKGATAA